MSGEIVVPGAFVPDDCQYEITLGFEGTRIAGPYVTAEAAASARRAMPRTLRMILRRQRYWIGPVES